MLLVDILQKYKESFSSIISFVEGHDCIVSIDLSSSNKLLTDEVVSDIHHFEQLIDQYLRSSSSTFAIGGYLENRDLYRRSEVFDGASSQEPRRLHLGIDVWGIVGTKVYAPIHGIIHSLADNKAKGDYGATIILQHELEGVKFHTLYGHLSTSDLTFKEGDSITAGQLIGHFGSHQENGYWPPHLHFQVIQDMEGMHGDYPGVCSSSSSLHYQHNCPDPDLILNLNRYLKY